MLGTLARWREDWDYRLVWILYGLIVVLAVTAAVLNERHANDPSYTARMAQQCVPSTQTAFSLHFKCVGNAFDSALEMYLTEHPTLEVAGIASFEHQTDFGSSGTKGYTVAFREKQKP